MSEQRPRLAFVSPLPPVRSGIADYAAELLPHLAATFDLEVFVADSHPLVHEGRWQSFPLHPARSFVDRLSGFDAVVYQMGNNQHHEFVLELARRIPGIVVLHDLVLHHLYEYLAWLHDDFQLYESVLRQSYGAMGDSILRWKRWALASERENFVFPLFEPLVAHSLGVLVHNRCAAEAVRRHLPGRPVRHVPMGIAPGVELDPRGARERLGLAEDRVVVGAFGFLTPIKRIPVLASALRRAWRECPELRLVLVGETSPGFRIEEIFEPQELRSGKVAHLGYVSPEGYRDWMAAVDLAVNLRYPTTLETSASLLRLLGQGKCTFVSAYRQFLEIPADAVVRIPLGINEEETLARELVSLARDSERRRRVGAAARAFVEREHSLSQAASAFSAAVCEIARTAADPKPPPLRRLRRTSRTSGIVGSARPREAGSVSLAPRAASSADFIVRNEGEAEWVSTAERTGGHVAVGAEIVARSGEVVGQIPPVLLARDLTLGEEETVRLCFIAPEAPGEYRLQPTLVHVGRGAPLEAGDALPLIVGRGAGV